jgi:hypothetical protein
MTCVPSCAALEGVQLKLPDEFMLLFDTLEAKKLSLTEYEGLVNPVVLTEKETGWPTVIVEPGERDSMETEGSALTVMDSCVVALSPCESLTVTVRLCVPTSLLVGVQLKSPDELISPLETLLPPKESLTE